MNRQTKAVICATGAVLCWATVASAFKIALAQASVYAMLSIAAPVAAIVFAIGLTVQRKWSEIRHICRSDLIYCCLLGLFNPFLYYIVLFAAYDMLPAHVAQPLNYLWPLLLTLLLAVVGHQRIPALKYLGMAVSLAGVAVISMGGGESEETFDIAGYAVAILSALLWAVYWLMNDRLKDRVDSTLALFLGFTTGTIALYIGLIFLPVTLPPVAAWPSCAYIGVMEMGLPFLLFAMALRNTDTPALVNQLCYLAPFLSLFIIAIVLHETVTPMTFLGLTLIITGIMFNQYGVEWLSRRLAAMALALFILPAPARSQDPVVNVSLEARADWQHDRIDGENINDNSGFKGRYLNLKVSGQINDQWSYNFRQRLNKTISEGTFFDATDWVYLTYSPTSRISFSAGKQVVAIGGYEYDRAPIDLYSCSEYWNNIACYQFGVSGAFRISGNDVITAQVVASPFRKAEGNNNNMYAYNLMWNGSHGFYQSIWSANLIECMPGKYINYLALGNKFTFGITSLELDFMNRAGGGQRFSIKDWSLMTEASVRPSSRLRLFAKFTHDYNNSGSNYDLCVLDGTDLCMIGGGAEFFPLTGRHEVRVHAAAFRSWGRNGNPSGTMQNHQTFIDLGITWRMGIFSLNR